jgi:hypothetical protein
LLLVVVSKGEWRQLEGGTSRGRAFADGGRWLLDDGRMVNETEISTRRLVHHDRRGCVERGRRLDLLTRLRTDAASLWRFGDLGELLTRREGLRRTGQIGNGLVFGSKEKVAEARSNERRLRDGEVGRGDARFGQEEVFSVLRK